MMHTTKQCDTQFRPRCLSTGTNQSLKDRSSVANGEKRSYAVVAWPLKAGTKTFCTNSSYNVGVVFAGDRGSSARICPLFNASDISHSKEAMFCDMPISVMA